MRCLTLFFIGLFISGCSQQTVQNFENLNIKGATKTIQLPNSKASILLPVSTKITGSGTILLIQYFSEVSMDEEWYDAEYFLEAQIFPMLNTLQNNSIEQIVSLDNCLPAADQNIWKGKNLAHRYASTNLLMPIKEGSLMRVENLCNFPGGLRQYRQVEREFCADPYKYFLFTEDNPKPKDDSWEEGNNYLYCSVLRDLKYLSNDQQEEVLKSFELFANEEYLLQFEGNIFRVRKSKETNKKGDLLLQQILLSTQNR